MRQFILRVISLTVLGLLIVTAPCQAQTAHPMGIVSSNDVLAGWPAANAIDGNPGSNYSSNYFATANNDRATLLAAWFSSGTAEFVSTLRLTARMWNGTPQGFPQSYAVYLTARDNSRWRYIGTYSTQPDSTGTANVDLGGIYSTYGVLVIPVTLGVDSYNNHYFQLAEIGLTAIGQAAVIHNGVI